MIYDMMECSLLKQRTYNSMKGIISYDITTRVSKQLSYEWSKKLTVAYMIWYDGASVLFLSLYYNYKEKGDDIKWNNSMRLLKLENNL